MKDVSIFDKMNDFFESCFDYFDSFFHNLKDVPHYISYSYDKIERIFDSMPEFILFSAVTICGIGIITKVLHWGK